MQQNREEDIKEDFLEVDPKIPGQNYACISFVSPEKVLQKKEIFYVTKFLENLFTSDDRFHVETREKMLNKDYKFTYENVSTLYEEWKYGKTDKIEGEFYEANDFRTSIRGLKVRGVYDTHKEASVRAQVLRRKDPNFNVFVGQVGYWLPWDPECESIQEQEYQENQLNDLVKKYKENLENRDNLFEQEKNERVEKARRDLKEKKEAMKQDAVKLTTEEEDKKNIESLREMVDESDGLYYKNLAQKSGEETKSEETVPVNGFETEQMKGLESDDPWIQRKKNE